MSDDDLDPNTAVPLEYTVGGYTQKDENTAHMVVTPSFHVVAAGRYVEDDAQIVKYGEGDRHNPADVLYVKFRDPWGRVGPWERVYTAKQVKENYGLPLEVLNEQAKQQLE